ncbi:MAG: lytic transglycosylase domain-containing protein [Solirubrobacteraceae bacterium]
MSSGLGRRARMRVSGSVLVLLALAVVAVLVAPLAQRVINHFTLPLQYAPIIRQQAAAKHLDPALVAAVIYAETRFRPRTSPTGAVGLMQIEPATALYLAHRSGGVTFTVADLSTPAINIAYGSYYLRYLLNEFRGNEVLALAAYNGGETNVDRWLHIAKVDGRALTIAGIPLLETRAYVREVLTKQRAYRRRYARQLGYG